MWAAGAVWRLPVTCALRLRARGFGITPGKLGLVYTLNDTARLIRAVGAPAAKDMLFSGRLMDGSEALSIGLVNRLVPPDRLAGEVDAYAGLLAATSPNSAKVTKQLIALVEAGQAEDDEATRALFLEAFSSADFQEGYRAFLEKRAPQFGRG